MTQLFIGLQAANRDDILSIYDPMVPYLRIVLPCGNVREYLNKKDVPVRSIRCDCTEVDYEHWFIVYTEEGKE